MASIAELKRSKQLVLVPTVACPIPKISVDEPEAQALSMPNPQGSA